MVGEARQITGAMQTEEQFEAAVAQLETSGIDRAQISLLAQEDVALSCAKAVGCDLANLPRVEIELADDRQQVRTLLTSLAATVASFAGVGAALAASGGAAAPALIAALASAGGAGGLTALFGRHRETENQDWARQQILQGGILVIVNPANAEQTEAASEILQRHCGRNVVFSTPL
ncbi:hypothetical protein [Mesorhizobium xinjiangense]|uniref:hypothetical protein n=1 Tax=Mesorhizobium xinjiangense TaxID=2678685 RepID=UPI0018DE71BF|nr:hypothetical protein [Mesorhizobium xinjiangense]